MCSAVSIRRRGSFEGDRHADSQRPVRRYKRDPELWGMAWWKPLYWALGFTCAMFLVSLHVLPTTSFEVC